MTIKEENDVTKTEESKETKYGEKGYHGKRSNRSNGKRRNRNRNRKSSSKENNRTTVKRDSSNDITWWNEFSQLNEVAANLSWQVMHGAPRQITYERRLAQAHMLKVVVLWLHNQCRHGALSLCTFLRCRYSQMWVSLCRCSSIVIIL